MQTLGRAHLGLGERKALDYFEQYLALTKALNVRAEHLALNELGGAYLSLGDHVKAIDTLEQSLARARHSGDLEGRGAAQEQLAAAFVGAGDLPAAERALRDAVGAWESVRAGLGGHDVFKVAVFERQTDAYQALQRVLIGLDKAEEALEIAERGRARAFVELLARRLTPNSTETLSPPEIDQIRRTAREHGATLVEYSILDGRGPLLVWVVKPSGEFVFRQIDLQQGQIDAARSLEMLVRYGRSQLGARVIGRRRRLSRRLRRQRPISIVVQAGV